MYKSIIIFFIGALTAYAIYAATGHGLTSYNIPIGYTTTVGEFSICKDVKNASTNANQNLFVPTATLNEWTAFSTNIPTNITVSDPLDPNNCCPTLCASCTGKACTRAN